MGKDIHMKLLEYSPEENTYKELALYRKNKDNEFKKIRLFDGRNSNMFDTMAGNDFCYDDDSFPCTSIALSSLEPELRKEIEKEMEDPGCFDFKEICLSDMKIYIDKYPEIKDWDKAFDCEDIASIPMKKNPLKQLFEDILTYLYFIDASYRWGYTPLSYYKIIYFFDC